MKSSLKFKSFIEKKRLLQLALIEFTQNLGLILRKLNGAKYYSDMKKSVRTDCAWGDVWFFNKKVSKKTKKFKLTVSVYKKSFFLPQNGSWINCASYFSLS